jgi:O-antigen/teichoic acid export membrane protein
MGLLLFGALSTLIRAFANPGVWILTRDIQLRGPTLLSVSSEIVGFLVTIGWTIAAPSAWAIVGGTVAASVTYTVGSHLLRPRTSFAWSREVASQIISFGGWMILSSGTYFLSSRGETLLLKGSISDVEFGCFAFASMIITTPVAAVTQLAAQVMFPMLSSAIREGREKAERQFARSKWVFTGLALCFVWGAVFVAPPIVALMHLKPSFDGLAWMVPMLGVRGALEIYMAPTGGVLFASGASRYSAWTNVIRLIVLVGGLYLTVGQWGLHGAMWVLVGAPILSSLALAPGLNKHLPKALGVEGAAFLVFAAGVAGAFALRQALS